MKPVQLWATAVWISLLLTTCSDRERGNPFDPANPDTGGRPVKLAAIPSDDFVSLYWDIPEHEDIQGGELLRSFGGTAATSILQGLLGVGATRDYLYPDSPLEREYWLEIAVEGWNGLHRSDTVSVILSPGICWAGTGYDGVFLISPATSTALPTVQLGSFLVDLSAGPTGVWAAGAPGGLIYQVEQSADSVVIGDAFVASLNVSSIDVAHDERVLLAHSSGLTWYDPLGHTLETWVEDPNLVPSMTRLSPDSHTGWVGTTDARLLRYVPPSTTPTDDWALSQISAICPASGDVCWAVAQGDLFRAVAGSSTVTPIAENVTAIAAVNEEECWVADRLEGTVKLVSVHGATVRSRTVSSPLLLAYSASDSVLWVVNNDRQIWKLLPDLRSAMMIVAPADPWSLAAP